MSNTYKLYAQEKVSTNAKSFSYVFLEGGGQGLASLNYEQSIYNNFSLRLGYGIFIPVMINYYLGEKYQFELGAGLTYSPYKIEPIVEKGKTLLYSITIGHKYQPNYGGLTLRFSFTPIYNPINSRIQIMGGISIGVSYK